MIVQQASQKRPVRSSAKKRTTRWWVWQNTAAWGTAFLFFLASFLFLIGSFMRLFRAVSSSRRATRAFILTPYFLGESTAQLVHPSISSRFPHVRVLHCTTVVQAACASRQGVLCLCLEPFRNGGGPHSTPEGRSGAAATER